MIWVSSSLRDISRILSIEISQGIFAVNNPTYDYTWNNDRRWAKNREPTENFLCPGISLNNNFDYKWDEQENTNPCSGKRVNIFDHANCGAKEPLFKNLLRYAHGNGAKFSNWDPKSTWSHGTNER